MRRFDKNENIRKVNLLAEQRYLQSKGLISENNNPYFEPEEIEHTVEIVENGGYDRDNYPQYNFKTDKGFKGNISSLDILQKLAGWEFTSECKSKNKSIVDVCNKLEDKSETYYNELVKTHGLDRGLLDHEGSVKFNEFIQKTFTHEIVTKIIELELGITLKQAIQKLINNKLINIDMAEPEKFREPDDYYNDGERRSNKQVRDKEWGGVDGEFTW
jgi:hypothetical protein